MADALRARLLDAATRLEQAVIRNHCEDGLLVGPDPIGKIHWRITRFVRSYLPVLPGDDRFRYVQAQAHWIRGLVLGVSGASETLARIEEAADGLLADQLDDGSWLHPPIRGRVGLVSTVEGAWGGLGLLSAFRSTKEDRFLEGALRWAQYQREVASLIPVGDGLAARYYSTSQLRIPNVTTMTVWLFGELYQATGDGSYLEDAEKMVCFLREAQLETGELPYDLDRTHFQCFQYNSFEFLDLAQFDALQTGVELQDVLRQLAGFLVPGVGADGHCRYDCHRSLPETNYWNAAIGAALAVATRKGCVDGENESRAAFERLLAAQLPDGRFTFSRNNYLFFEDRRFYPRQLAMILHCVRLGAGESDER